MATDTSIRPVMTAEEWAMVKAEKITLREPAEILPRRDPDSPRFTWDTASVIALANHQLPDGDPRKITFNDAVACVAAAEWGTLGPKAREQLRLLGEKLNALLPPE